MKENDFFSELIVDVKTFGAKGDGISDDSTAIQDALNTGKSILISNGVYIIQSSISTTRDNQRIIGNGLIKLEQKSLTWSIIKLKDNNILIDGVGIDNRNAQGAIHVFGNNCTISNCTFIETGYRGYQVYIGSNCENTVIHRNKFIGGNTNEPVLFISKARRVMVTENYFKDVGSWAVHTDHVDGVIINGNVCENAVYDDYINAKEGQNIFSFDTNNMFKFPSYGIIVFSGNQVIKSGYSKISKQGNITITFNKGRKSSEIIRCLAFKGAENLNINSQSKDCIIINNRLINSGDSNITVASDYSGEIIDAKNTKETDYPKNITIQNNHLENAFGCNIAVSHTDNINILGNTCINAGFGQFSTFYNSGIAVPQNIRCHIENNTLKNINNGISQIGILALENSIETKKIIKNNIFSNIPVKYYLGAESDYKDFKSGVFIEGIYQHYGSLSETIDEKWKNNYLPVDTDFFLFDQYKNISSKEIAILNNKKTSSIRIENSVDGYFGINFKKISFFKNTLARIKIQAHTKQSQGKGIVQVLYRWGNNYQTKDIPITGSIYNVYEIYIPFSNPQDIRIRLLSNKNSDIYYIHDVEVFYLKY